MWRFILPLCLAFYGVSCMSTEPISYYGMCDGSAAVALDRDHFIIANDEDNVLRIYNADRGGLPTASFSLDLFLKSDEKHPETDLEGAAQCGDLVYWIGSHGANKEGKERPSRRRLFATRISRLGSDFHVEPVGLAYTSLIEDLSADSRYQEFHLRTAATLPPKEKDALNIEGLAADAHGVLWIGFRNPLPQNKALLAPLKNPRDVIDGKKAEFGDPVLLDLGGLGVRDLAWHDGKFYLIGGSYKRGGTFEVFRWDGQGAQPRKIDHPSLKHFNAESLVFYPGRADVQVISDDGNVRVGVEPCKTVSDINARHFRAFWMPIEK